MLCSMWSMRMHPEASAEEVACRCHRRTQPSPSCSQVVLRAPAPTFLLTVVEAAFTCRQGGEQAPQPP